MMDLSPPTATEPMTFEQAVEVVNRLKDRLNSVLLGQTEVVDQVLTALISNGHILIEGVPGLGKTLLVQTLAQCFSGDFKRIQFTPDLMPADITGHAIYDMKEGAFRMRAGPVFTNLLLADEINRAPAKTQAALLEVMQERQVTIEGKSRALEAPFMVLATQNPLEQEGTYPLPEAELDRFLMKIFIDYPSHEDEVQLARSITTGHISDSLSAGAGDAILDAAQVVALQAAAASVEIDDQVLDYAVRLVRASRESMAIQRGAGPRASIALLRAARANALLRGSNFVLPDDVKKMAWPVMRHRIQLATEMEIDGQSEDLVLEQLFNTVDAPRK
ncbi:MoxR family ATPase [Pseudomaricurvus sp. HS19]|uniref:AAA family ATPase n=1 Tax=Pseudomaricurvus sp. HS19 TaxID=2692626 RepID=UPI0013681F1D|nr:AAA family ATPase [Pseudomaricurvus sp. HS19]MYM62944.1 AAA domain-containing protein [Pseudomaricurvus sp. HS19]